MALSSATASGRVFLQAWLLECSRAVSGSAAYPGLGFAGSQPTGTRGSASVHATALQAVQEYQTAPISHVSSLEFDIVCSLQPLWILLEIQTLFKGRWVIIVEHFFNSIFHTLSRT